MRTGWSIAMLTASGRWWVGNGEQLEPKVSVQSSGAGGQQEYPPSPPLRGPAQAGRDIDEVKGGKLAGNPDQGVHVGPAGRSRQRRVSWIKAVENILS